MPFIEIPSEDHLRKAEIMEEIDQIPNLLNLLENRNQNDKQTKQYGEYTLADGTKVLVIIDNINGKIDIKIWQD